MTYPATLDVYTTVNSGDTISAAMFNTPNDGVEKLMIEMGIDGTVAESVKYKVDNFFVAASHVFFAQATPPTGWTIDASHKDNVLACKADSGVYSVVGANKGTFSITSANVQAHTHTIEARTDRQAITAAGANEIAQTALSDATMTTSSVGSGDGLYRPYATVGVIATYTGA